ncbi:DUF4209 domain-containing protein [Rufibacter soli]
MTIAEIYQIIDKPDYIPFEGYQNKIIPLFKDFRDGGLLEIQPALAKAAQIEIDIQSFGINGNKLLPVFTTTDNLGVCHEYPSLKGWTDEDYRYLIERQGQTLNPYLKATYSHILWLSPKKHLRVALDALSAYTEIISSLEAGGIEDTYRFMNFLSNAFKLAVSTGNKGEIEQVKAIFLNTLQRCRLHPEAVFVIIGLNETMLSNPKVFKQVDFAEVDGLCLTLAETQASQHTKIKILEMGQKVTQKLGRDMRVFSGEIAKAYEALCHLREDDTKLSAIKFCQEAIDHYKLARNPAKVRELEERYKLLKQEMIMGSIGYEVDMTEAYKDIRAAANELLKGNSDHILQFLMYSNEIFPSYEYLYGEAVKSQKENSFQSLMGKTVIDGFGHPSAHYNEESEKIHFSIMETLLQSTRMISQVLLREIVLKSVDSGKLSPVLFLKFLNRSSWLGQDITVRHKQGETKRYNWLDLLAPGINDFFSQLYFHSLNPINVPNFVLAIDSLSLKIEGILRDMCDLRGGITFFQTEDSLGRPIMREKDINVLLREPEIKDTLSQDDFMLLQFLLVDKVGLNLRNRVAHTLIRDVDGYGFQYMLLLVALILRLAKNEYAPPTRHGLADLAD